MKIPWHLGAALVAAGILLAPEGPALADPAPRTTFKSPAADSAEGSTVPAVNPPLPPASMRRWQTGLLRPDRLQHATFSLTCGMMIGSATRSRGWAAGGAVALGLAKEIMDREHSGFDTLDLIADALGAAAAGSVTHLLSR